jgi:ribosomal-protein-alanine N-acetyltransferase
MVGMAQPSLGQPLIRDVRAEDAQLLYDIDQICFPADLAYSRAEFLSYLRHPLLIGKVAEVQGKVSGFAIARLEAGAHAHVITLDVIPEARRRKVGTRLIEALHREFRKRGVTQITLEVDTSNEAAQRFYLKMGYLRRVLLRGYYKARKDAYSMVLIF